MQRQDSTESGTGVVRSVMQRTVRLAKRAIDIAGAAVGLAVTAPLMPLIAAAIYLDSPGPILFRQRRAGSLRGIKQQNGVRKLEFEEFDMHKFRTMIPNAEAKTGVVVAGQDDPRITRVGKFLRKPRLDELPQFWDVLRGKMSLVGPRPERPELLQDLSYAIPLFEERMRDVKPGITGLPIGVDVASDAELSAAAATNGGPGRSDETHGIREARIGSTAFRNATGLVQVNQTVGAGNATANSFVLRP